MAALLNGESTDLFVAYIRRQGGDPLLFMVNPHAVEAVSLRGKATRWWAEDSEVESQFPRGGRPRDLQITGERTDAAEIKRYTITVDLPQSSIGEIAFAATAHMDITARSARAAACVSCRAGQSLPASCSACRSTSRIWR